MRISGAFAEPSLRRTRTVDPLLTMNVRRGPIHAGPGVAVRVCRYRRSPRLVAFCAVVRPWRDLRLWSRYGAGAALGARNMDVLIAKLCEVELDHPFGVGEEVDLDDLAVPDRDGGDRERLAVEEGDHPGGAVDERAAHGQVDPRPQQRLPGDGLRPPNVLR